MTRTNWTMFVLLAAVLGAIAAATASAEYIDNHNETVTDTVTGLTWQQGDAQNDAGGRTWEQALAYCEDLRLDERTDWRLPNIRELRSLVDYSRYNPAINPIFMCRTTWYGYWSSTTGVADVPTSAWSVSFSHGDDGWYYKGYHYYYVRCVRGGPSGSFDHLIISSIASPQAIGVPFAVTITARDANGTTDTSFNGEVGLSSTIGLVSPMTAYFTNGSVTLSNVRIDSGGAGVRLLASGQGRSGVSNAFDVTGGVSDAHLSGYVKDRDCTREADAAVYLKLGGSPVVTSTASDATGYYWFSNLAPGEYTISAVAIDGRKSGEYRKSLSNHASLTQDVFIEGNDCNPTGLTPVLFLPGILGSSTGDGGPYPTLPKSPPDWDDSAWNTRSWGLHDPDLGFVLHVGWRNLIDAFRSLDSNYQVGCTLFPVPYDWRMDIDQAADKYLEPKIIEAKSKAGTGKVNIIAHSTGGLVTRAYIQGDDYHYDIDKFAMVGVPNHGAANPYYIWQGGDPITADLVNMGVPLAYTPSMMLQFLTFYRNPPPDVPGGLIYRAGMQRLAKKHCTSLKQLLATYDLLNDNRSVECDPNDWLVDLNASSHVDRMGKADDTSGKVKTKIFAGTGQKTIEYLKVCAKNCSAFGFYQDGYPYDYNKASYGDGTVLTTSASLGSLVSYTEEEGSHSSLIDTYRADLVQFIDGRSISSTMLRSDALGESTGKELSISVFGRAQPYLTDPSGRHIGINPGTYDQENGFSEAGVVNMGAESGSIVISEPEDGEYELILKDGYVEDFQLVFSYRDGETNVEKRFGSYSPGATISFGFTLDSTSAEPLTVSRSPAPPSNLLATAYTSSALKTKLCWSASPDTNGYRVYAKGEDEAVLSPLTTIAATCFETSDLWAADSSIETRLYAVSAVKADGSESFLSNFEKNNDRDHDGLSDEEETAFGSDLTKADTDGDGLQDGEEYLHGTSPVLKDTDGDGCSDYVEIRAGTDPLDDSSKPAVTTTGVFRPDNGLIYLKKENTTGFADASLCYGIAGDIPIAGDWDGDGVDGIGIYRNGSFYLKNTIATGYADMVFAFGQDGDKPVAGDWDGDGIDTIGIYRNGLFLLRNSNSTGPAEMSFLLGIPNDVPLAGNWDGVGGDSCGVFRPDNGLIFLKNENTSGYADVAITFGIPNDKPVMGDWDGDGVDTIGVYRNGAFLLRNTNQTGFAEMMFWLGQDRDVPISGKWGLP